MIDKDTLESMLWIWGSFRRREFNEVSWPSVSIAGKLMEAAKLESYSRGTSCKVVEIEVPEFIDSIQKALIQIPLSNQLVIKAEYTDSRGQKKKAKLLKISISNYRVKLCRARSRLRALI